ncbi:unnamed protein product [Phytomonas sp. EM1]|nr:unnamed protein product [Phytomonas sp. EM1]|eukprot:CCW60809.1 unnamed protein product [Phytomonas sp. isolate EM1]
MRAVKFLVKLYDMRPEHGNITAFENYANHVYVGTNTGCLLYLQVEGLMEYDMRSADNVCYSNGNGVNPHSTSTNTSLTELDDDKLAKEEEEDVANDIAPEAIYTSLLAFTRFPETASIPITHIQHSQSHPIIFALSNQHLCAFNALDLTYLFDVPGSIGTFFIYPLGPNNTEAPFETLQSLTRIYGAKSAPPVECPTEEAATHVICAAQHSGKSLFAFEVNLNQNKNSRAVLKQELLLPEPALALVAQAGVVCVGMRREYSVLSLDNGLSKGLLSLHGTSHSPLLAFGEGGGVYMRYRHCVFTTSMQSMLTTSTPYSIPTTSASAFSQPVGALPTTSIGTPLQGRVYYLRDEVRAIVSQFPFFFAFYKDYCDVFSVFEEEPIESLPLPGVCFAPKPIHGRRVFMAGARTLWMATLQGIRYQLTAMVERFKIEEAFELLTAYQRSTHSSQRGLEEELKRRAGIACLKRARPHIAMKYFGETINPRELAMHLPECASLPEPRQQRYLKAQHTPLQCISPMVEMHDEIVEEGFALPGLTASSLSLKIDAQDREGRVDTSITSGARGSYQKMPARPTCNDWCQCSSWNLPVGGLEQAWFETYETFPFIPLDVPASSYHVYPHSSTGYGERQASQGQNLSLAEEEANNKNTCGQAMKAGGGVRLSSQPLHAITRQVPNMGCVTAQEFTARCLQDFRDAILEYFSFRLAKLWKEVAGTPATGASGADGTNANNLREICDEKLSAAQVMEYVLLVLALNQQDDRGVYRVISTSIGLQVEDCYDLLVGLGEYRILSCLLFRRGFVRDALALLRSRVYVSSYFSPRLLSVESHFLSHQTETCNGNVKRGDVNYWIDLLLKYWQERRYITNDSPGELKGGNGSNGAQYLDVEEREREANFMSTLAPVACGVWCLPRVIRGQLLSRLLGITIPSVEKSEMTPSIHSIAAEVVSRDLQSTEYHKADTDVAAMPSADGSDSWARPLAEFYVNGIQEMARQAKSIRYDEKVWGGAPTSVDVVGASPEVISIVGPLELACNFDMSSEDTSDAFHYVCEGNHADTSRTANRTLVAPNSLSEIFFLVDKMNLSALKDFLSMNPKHALCRDEEGCTALHVAFGQVMRRLKCTIADPKPSNLHVDIESSSPLPFDDAAVHGNVGGLPNQEDDRVALLELLLSIALLLVNFGCPTAAINRYGMSCLDILAVSGAEVYVEIMASALAAALELNMVCAPPTGL